MRGGEIVILVNFLAPDESQSSQRIGMLDTRHEKAWEQSDDDDNHSASDDPWAPLWLPVSGN